MGRRRWSSRASAAPSRSIPRPGTIAVTSGGDGTILLLDDEGISTIELPTPLDEGGHLLWAGGGDRIDGPGGAMSAHRSLFDDALLRAAERHGRPGLPVGGFTLGRADDRSRRGIHRRRRHDRDRARWSPAPDLPLPRPPTRRRRVGAPPPTRTPCSASSTSPPARCALHPDIRLRYDTVVWAADSREPRRRRESRDRMLVTLDLENGYATGGPPRVRGATAAVPWREERTARPELGFPRHDADRPGHRDPSGTVARAPARRTARRRRAGVARRRA